MGAAESGGPGQAFDGDGDMGMAPVDMEQAMGSFSPEWSNDTVSCSRARFTLVRRPRTFAENCHQLRSLAFVYMLQGGWVRLMRYAHNPWCFCKLKGTRMQFKRIVMRCNRRAQSCFSLCLLGVGKHLRDRGVRDEWVQLVEILDINRRIKRLGLTPPVYA